MPPLQLPGEHFATALGFMALGALCLVFIAPELAAGAFLTPHVAAVTHLFTLGFISLSIFGALYQFLPIAVGASIRFERLAHVTFALLVLGIPVFVGTLAEGLLRFVPVGGALVALAFALFAVNLAWTLAQAPERNLTWWALAGACAFLVITLGFGLTLALNLADAGLGAARFDFLLRHVHVALAGWVMLVVAGVAQRLLPMFLLSHGASELPARLAVICLATGSLALALPLVERLHCAAWFIIGAGAVAFLVQAALFYGHRRRKELDPGMRLAFAGLAGIGAALAIAPFALVQGWHNVRAITAYMFLLVVGGFTLFIAGHYFKIVPFLVWQHRFGPRVGKQPVPRVSELYSARPAELAVRAFPISVATAALGIMLGIPGLVRLGAMGFFGSVLLEVREMVRIARARPA